ncbi:MAG: Asp-tRNA(Asn)/Glu-tRNA(Gln) amidotransferase subunit GatC [Firmicutes bacterium]|nr:Asp-tRNA(Asn)/Glu-tRNA(Gln) amidotransferase subunit GatC [Alicyclobacillaceae bacterium]MCL6497901.1 Asp-tRNA(Asn)/Glu-tRNA(Gln) amidotransferase subunit GatC [Bacillota bacterium]
MGFSEADVYYVARLARLAVSREEVARLVGDLNRVLDYVAKLQSLPTETVAPTFHGVERASAMREDVPEPSLQPAAVVAEAPAARDGMFVVPRILEDDTGREGGEG